MPASSSGSEPTPPSAATSAPEPPRRAGGRFALALAVAAALACWNPLGAPFALVAGVGAVAFALRPLSRGPRRLAATALALGAGAAVASVLVLLAAAGVGIGPEEKLGVEPRPRAELDRVLDGAAAASREGRERAARELDALPAPPAEDGAAKRAGRR